MREAEREVLEALKAQAARRGQTATRLNQPGEIVHRDVGPVPRLMCERRARLMRTLVELNCASSPPMRPNDWTSTIESAKATHVALELLDVRRAGNSNS